MNNKKKRNFQKKQTKLHNTLTLTKSRRNIMKRMVWISWIPTSLFALFVYSVIQGAWQHGFDVVLFIFFILFVVFPLQEHFRLKSTLTLSDSGITSSRFKEFNANGFVPWKYIVSVKHTHFRHGTRCIDVRVNAEMLKKQRGIPDHVFYTLTKRIFVNQFEQSEKEITQLINKQVGYKGDERLKDIGSIIREISDTFT